MDLDRVLTTEPIQKQANGLNYDDASRTQAGGVTVVCLPVLLINVRAHLLVGWIFLCERPARIMSNAVEWGRAHGE